MDNKQYWSNKHQKYSATDWIDNPSLFSKFTLEFLPKQGNLLDLGCGQGQDSRFFSENGFKVTAADFSLAALDIAKAKTKLDLDIVYEPHDMQEKFVYEDDSFDVVYSHMAIHYFDNEVTNKLFFELTRVLKPNGILAVQVNSKSDPEIINSKIISEDLYETPSGLIKRFFDEASILKFAQNKFETIVLDSKGETYKDENKSLIRYIGKKLI